MNDILKEVHEKYGEYIEMWGAEAPQTIILPIVIQMLEKERQLNTYYKRRLEAKGIDYECTCSTKH